MAQLSVKQYDALERAIADARRISVLRRGTEYIVIPVQLVTVGRSEAIITRHPTTGAKLTLKLDEIDAIEVVK